MERLDESVADTIRVLAQSVQDLGWRVCLEGACPTPLTRNQFLILNLLDARGARPIGEIASLLDISSPAASKNIDRLQQLGMVERRHRPTDRRVHEVAIQAEGRDVVERFVTAASARDLQLLERFSQDEKELLLGLLRRVVHLALRAEKRLDAICLQCYRRHGEDCVVRDLVGECLHDSEH